MKKHKSSTTFELKTARHSIGNTVSVQAEPRLKKTDSTINIAIITC